MADLAAGAADGTEAISEWLSNINPDYSRWAHCFDDVGLERACDLSMLRNGATLSELKERLRASGAKTGPVNRILDAAAELHVGIDSEQTTGGPGRMMKLLSWAMLAASTVGPGTVVCFSKAGADTGLSLLWCVVLACGVSYTVLEATARLVIVSGQQFGEAMRNKFGSGLRTPAACSVVGRVAVWVVHGSMLRVLVCRGLRKVRESFSVSAPVSHCSLFAVAQAALGVFVGNSLYEANNFAGGMEAANIMAGAGAGDESPVFRVTVVTLWALAVARILTR
jgi:hypothetical protein